MEKPPASKQAMQSPAAQIQDSESFSTPAMTKQRPAMEDHHGTPQNSNSESSPPPHRSDDEALACGGAQSETTPARKAPVQPAAEVEDTLDGSEYAHLALAVVTTPMPMVTGTAQRGLWGMYSSTVLQRRGSGSAHSRRCASPTRGARELAKILRTESGSVSSLMPAGSGTASSPGGTAEQDPDGSSSDIQSAPSMLPLEDGVSETLPEVVSEAPEIIRARERAARARENAARAVEKARAQRAAEAAARAAAKSTVEVRRRIAGKQKSPPAFPPPPAATTAADADVAVQATAPPAGQHDQEQEQEQWSTPLMSPKKRRTQQDAAKGDIPTPPRSKLSRREEQPGNMHGVNATLAGTPQQEPSGSPSMLAAAASQGRGRGAAKRR